MKKYIVRLNDEERQVCMKVIRKLKGRMNVSDSAQALAAQVADLVYATAVADATKKTGGSSTLTCRWT